jgi:hypothetical protein
MRFIKNSFGSGCASGDDRRSSEKKSEMADDSMVMPRSCSSGRESR